MNRILGSVVIELDDAGNQVRSVDIRVYKWLGQWLNMEEAKQLVYSLSARHLTELVIVYRPAIEAMPMWNEV